MVAGLILLVVSPTSSQGGLAEAVRQQRWHEVRAFAEDVAKPYPPAFAVAAARAARHTERPLEARSIATGALADAGDLAALLRLEAGEAQIQLGEDPWRMIEPLLSRQTPNALRIAAANLIERAWDGLPLSTVESHRIHRLTSTLRRRLDAVLARRHDDTAAATALLEAATGDRAAFELASWLRTRPGLSPRQRILAADALLAGGMWREAGNLLDVEAPVDDPELLHRSTYLEGRVAYRLERFDAAAGAFERALASAPDDQARFTSAVQLARVAEIAGDFGGATRFWRSARIADRDQPVGWEGEAKATLLGGDATAVPTLLRQAPRRAREAAAERLAAILLARGENAAAVQTLQLVGHTPRAAFLAVVSDLANGRRNAARRHAIEILADRHAGGWRELVLDLFPRTGMERPADATRPDVPAAPTADIRVLAETAIRRGPAAARRALTSSLAADPSWNRLLAGDLSQPVLPPHLAALLSCGLEFDAAWYYARDFPAGAPLELAWSAAKLAAWGNGPQSLTYGERLWGALGGVPASLVPDPLLPRILPPQLVTDIAAAAGRAGVSPALLVGVIRRESRFDSKARSAAGAVGMAQIVPETARRHGATVDELSNASTALSLAAAEMARIHERFGTGTVLAAAAYNAGDTVVRSWLAATGSGVADPLLAAAIPYTETSDYVVAVREGEALARYLE